MQTVGLSVILGADFSSAEEAMAKFRQSVNSLASETSKAFANMAGTAANIGNAFKPVADGARNATQVVINESKARQQADNEETSAALNASKLKIQALREEQAAQRAATQAKKAEKDLYAQEVAAQNEIVRAYYNAAIALRKYGEASGFTAQQIEEMAIKAREGQEMLKQIEAGAGRFQRNVGNYSGATQYLSQSIAQLSGEIPNFFQSMRIGFMSIGNNIQPISQAIKGLRAENAQLLAQGKQTVPVLSTVIKSFLGWQTILLVGVGLVSRYGAELIDWATGADKAKAKAEALKKQQEEWNQITESSNKTAADQIAKLEVLNSTMTDGNLSMDKRVAAYNEAKKLYPSYLEHLDKDKALNTGIADIIDNQLVPAIMAAATARAYEGKISDIVAKNIELNEKKKVASYEKTRKETDYLIAKEKARANGNDYTVTPLGGVVRTSGNAELTHASRIYEEASKKVADFDAQIQNNNAHLEVLKKDLVAAMAGAGALGIDGIDPLTHKTTQAKEKVDALTKSSNTLNTKFSEIDAKLNAGLLTTFDAIKERISVVNQYLDSLFKNGGRKEDIAKYIDLLKRFNYELSSAKPIDLSAAKGVNAGDEFKKSLEAGKAAQNQAAKLYDQLNIGDPKKGIKRREKDATEEARALNREFNKTYALTNKLVGGPLDSFVGALFKGENALDAVGNSIKDIVSNLATAVIKAGIFSAIMSAVNPVGFATGGGFLGVLGKLLPFASGGIVTGPTPALVGEAGPEAIIPLNKLGSIMNNRDINVRISGRLRGMDINVANEKAQAFKTR